MATPFLRSEEYDERAHQLYNEGQYDEALSVLHEGLVLYPDSVQLHVVVVYAQLAREDYAWARISLANILYDQNEYEAALYHFERTDPDDHWDELGIWRLVELKRSLYRLEENDPELKPWDERLSELAADMDDVDTMLMELEPQSGANGAPGAETARGQLELFGTLLSSLAEQKHAPEHQII